VTRDLAEVATFNARHAAGAGAGRALVDSLETRVATPEAVPGIAAALPRAYPVRSSFRSRPSPVRS